MFVKNNYVNNNGTTITCLVLSCHNSQYCVCSLGNVLSCHDNSTIMELLLDHLKAEISTLSGSLPDLKHFIKDYIATKDTDERLKCLRVTLKLDRWGEKISLCMI